MYVHNLSLLSHESRTILVEHQLYAIESNLSASGSNIEELISLCNGNWFQSVSQMYQVRATGTLM